MNLYPITELKLHSTSHLDEGLMQDAYLILISFQLLLAHKFKRLM